MTVSGPNRSPSQTAINTANAAAEAAKTAGAAVAKGAQAVGKAVGSAAGAVADSFGAAKLGAFEGIKGAASGIMAGGCCMPPPGKLPVTPGGGGALGKIGGGLKGIDFEGIGKRLAADAAKDKFDKTVDDSMKPGSKDGAKISDGEQRKINSAGRDWKIAEKKVDLHEANKELEKSVNTAKADGNISNDEQKKINDAQGKVDNLKKQLDGMVAKDAIQDSTDRVLDMFDKVGGGKPGPLGPLGPFGPGIKGPGGLPEPPGGKIWDEKLPPHLGGDPHKLPDIGPGGLFPKPDWKPFPPDFKLPKLPDLKLPDFKLPDFKLPDINDLPFPKLPAFPQPPVWTCRPPMFETFKPPFLL